jgi:hypothetical protein
MKKGLKHHYKNFKIINLTDSEVKIEDLISYIGPTQYLKWEIYKNISKFTLYDNINYFNFSFEYGENLTFFMGRAVFKIVFIFNGKICNILYEYSEGGA